MRLMLLSILQLLLCLGASGQSPDAGMEQGREERDNFIFKQISINEGLSQSYVTAIYRDRTGVLWIGTRNGLNRFHKNNMESYYHSSDDDDSIPGNVILDIIGDREGKIWVSTFAGLAYIDPVDEKFHLVDSLRVAASVETESGIFWMGNDFLLRLNYTTGVVERIETNRRLIDIERSGSGDLMLAVYDGGTYGLVEYDINEATFGQKIELNIGSVNDFVVTPQGDYFVSYTNNGLLRFDADGTLLRHYTTENSGLSSNLIMDIIMNGESVWIATDGGGINILDPRTDRFDVITRTEESDNSLKVDSFYTLVKDDDIVWAGSVRGGVICIRNSYVQNFNNTGLLAHEGLSNKTVISLLMDREGILWIGTDGGGINRYDPGGGRFFHHPITQAGKVVSMAEFSDDKLLLSLYERGVFLFDKRTGAYEPFQIPEGVSKGWMVGVLNVSAGKIYVISENIFAYDTRDGKYHIVTDADNSATGLNINAVHVSANRCFIANKSMIFEIDTTTDRVKPVGSVSSDETISSLSYSDADSVLWVGSDAGICSFDLRTGVSQKIETGLFNTVSRLSVDKGRLWVCADNKYYSYIPDRNRFVEWSEFDGFRPNEILTGYYDPASSNKIYFGGTEGLTVIDSAIPMPDESLPVPTLNNIVLNGHSRLDRLKDDRIKIPHDYGSLSIHMDINERDLFRNTRLTYYINGNSQYRYESRSNNVIDLPSLAPDTYRVYVSCYAKTGEWTQPLPLLTIEVVPPWYATTLAMAGFVALALSCAGLFILADRKRKRVRERERMQRQRESLNESKIRFLTNISHELRTPLTLIYSPLKRLLSKETSADRPLLRGMYRQAKEMKNIIDMTLDIRKFDSDYNDLSLRVHDVNTWIKGVCEGFESEYAESDVELRCSLDASVGGVVFDRGKCSIVLYNLLSNALKFSHGGTAVQISSTLVDGFLQIAVEDEGIGLAHVDVDRLFDNFYTGNHDKSGSGIGLSYSKQLIELHNGRISAIENHSGGATFSFTIPLCLAVDAQTDVYPVVDDTPDSPDPFDTPINGYAFPGKTVIVIDDHPGLTHYMKTIFEPLFDTVYVAHDGRQGVEMIKEHKPDMIISDVVMPVMGGFELCRMVKEDIEISHIPVILLTAKNDSESIATGYKTGADIYLPKPFEEESVLAAISNLFKAGERIKMAFRANETQISPRESTISLADEAFMTKLNLIIETNIDSAELNIDFLTSNLGMSRTSLYNKIKNITGMSAIDYIAKIRIDKARALLVETDMDIKEIAYRLGFSNQQYFSTLFKKATNMSPSSYRGR